MHFAQIDIASLLYKAGYSKKEISFALPSLYIKARLLSMARDILHHHHMGQKIALLCDPDSYEAIGTFFFEEIQQSFSSEIFMLPHNPCADDKNVAWITEKTQAYDALIAIGSGTISDLCKYVASKENKSYSVVATALSMNGYASCYASITMHGYKTSFKATLPRVIIMDEVLLRNAPKRLTLSGVGDSLCRATAEWDWKLSHHVIHSAYDARPSHLIRSYEKKLIENYSQLFSEDNSDVIHNFGLLLILSGLGMTLSQGSYPASQSEHMIAHSYHMLAAQAKLPSICSLHGEEVGVTSLYIQEKQREILKVMHEGKIRLRPLLFCEEKMISLFGEEVAMFCKKEIDAKNEHMCEALKKPIEWRDIAHDLSDIPQPCIRTILSDLQAPLTPCGIGWREDIFKQAGIYASHTRNRFTCLDIDSTGF